MKKGKIVFAFIVLVFVLTLYLSSASFKYSNENIVKSYLGGEKIKGFINLTLEDENADAIVKSNYNDSGITLLSLLEKNGFTESVNFNCSNANCQNTYTAENEITTINFDGKDEEYIGFRLSGEDAEVNSISFKVNTDSQASCSAGFSIDVLGNESLRLQGNSYNDVACGPRIKGCFDEGISHDMAIISSTPYCQRIDLTSSPAYRIGAKVENSTNGGKLTMRLFDEEWNPLGNCILPKHSQSTEELSCIVNHTVIKKEAYYVCIETDRNSNDFEIETETKGDICGNSDVDFHEYARDYNIFAQPLQYNTQNIVIDNDAVSKIGEQNLVDYANDYLSEVYDNDCSDDCIIPFKVNSQVTQAISLLTPELKYESSGATLTNNKIYSVEEKKAEIDAKSLRINLEYADLYLPLSTSTKELQLYINNKPIFSKKIAINITSGFSFDISPKVIPFAIDTTFYIISNQNITYSKWNFGNGEVREASKGFTSYTYLQDGNYNITVEATNSKNAKTSQTFSVIVGNVSESLTKLINQSKVKLSSLEKSINLLEPWIKSEVLESENITLYKDLINSIEGSIDDDENESNTYLYVSELYSLDMPKMINYTSLGKLPLEVGFGSIDSSYVKALASDCSDENGECTSYDWVEEEKVNDYLISWNSINYDSQVSYKTLSRIMQQGSKPLFTYFNLQIVSKESLTHDRYLIIPFPKDSITFKQDYGQIEITGDYDAIAIAITDDKNIEFLISGEVTPVDLGAFVSPSLDFIIDDLEIEPSCQDNPDLPECEKRSGLWLYILLALGVLVLYIVLQEWYKRRYQAYLFPNADDLYNIINYIHNSRISGMTNAQINKALLDIKWSQEQIIFAFNKIDGKRTGMWEIPIFKFFENRKVQKELEKRRQESSQNIANGGNARFFNRLN